MGTQKLIKGFDKFFLVLLLFTIVNNVNGQEWDWLKTAGGSGNDYGVRIAVDNEGNLIMAGTFQSTADFDSIKIYGKGGSDIFIAKYNVQGEVIWAISAGGDYEETLEDISVDVNGNIYITGGFRRTAYIGSDTLVSLDGSYFDLYHAKYDKDGKGLWGKMAGTENDYDWGTAIIGDDNGNCYVAGLFSATISLGSFNLTSQGEDDMYLVKYDSNGNEQWVNTAGGLLGSHPMGIGMDEDGNIYVFGEYDSDLSFDTITLTSKGYQDMYLAKYNSNGNLLWAKGYTGSSSTSNQPKDMTVGEDGYLFITGSFRDSLYLGSWKLYAASGEKNSYIAKIDKNGEPVWARQSFGGNTFVQAVTVDKINSSYICGTISQGDVIFGHDTVNAVGGQDIFITKYDSLGNYVWSKQSKGTSYNYIEDIAVDLSNNVYFTGNFNDTIVFDTIQLYADDDDVYFGKITADNITQIESKEVALDRNIIVYPNPTSGHLSISLGNYYEDINVTVRNMTGQIISTYHIGATNRFDIEIIGTTGIYLVHIETLSGKSATIKVLKE